MKHNNNFDLIRLIAASQVVSMHAGEWLHLPMYGALPWLSLFPGVAVFFVTSGFLVAGSYMDRQKELWPYFRNRALRIYPALWVNLFVILALLWAAGVLTWDSLTQRWFAAYLLTMIPTASTLLVNYLVPSQVFHWNDTIPFFPGGALWTIPIELSFYVVLPLLLVTKRPIYIVAVAAVASLAFAIKYGAVLGPLWTATCAPYLWVFLLGALARLSWSLVKPVFSGTFLVWAAVMVAYCWNYSVAPNYQVPTSENIIAVVLLAATTLSFAHTMPWLSKKILQGHDISYGVYLYHMPLIMIFMWGGLRGEGWLWIAVYVSTAAVAWVSWLRVERPMRDFKKGKPSRDLVSTPLPGL